MASNPRQSAETQFMANEDSAEKDDIATPDSDDTPRTENPIIISTLPTPGRVEISHDEPGYFALKPTESHTSAATSDVQASPTPSIASSSSSSLKLRETVLDVTRRLSAHFDQSPRPGVQRDISNASVESTDSTVTVRAPHYGPKYPNQAFSALHQQQYPSPHLPPTLRAKSYNPTQTVNFSSAIAALHQSGLHTTSNTPVKTPGLFNPSPTEPPDTPTSEGAYPSPYLHYLHTQIPKETHVADIDVDPISGRKIINGYEIMDELGRGTHGKVKLGRSLTTGTYVAIKIVERYSKKRRLGRLGNAEDKVKKEVAILKKARHPNIVALLEVIDDPTRKKVYIVLERVDLGEIMWRVDAAKEIAMVEYRRYERESHGIFDDAVAEEEDQAVLDLGRMRRAKAARSRYRKMRRERELGRERMQHVWSIEMAGDSGDDDSDLDAWSRFSASTDDPAMVAELDRIMSHHGRSRDHSRSHTPVLGHEHDFEDENTETPDRHTSEADFLNSRLEGTMYGGYDGSETDEPSSHAPPVMPLDLTELTRNLSHDNLLERATDILDVDMHPDVMYAPCMTMAGARAAFRDTLLGLQYLHYQGIIHRDIKPPNLLQTRDRRTKISDFGVSYLGRPIDEGQAENLSESDAQDFDEAKELAKTVGTAAFYAPELCYTEALIDHPPVGKAIDVWALGITLFCMLFARVPFVDSEYVVMRQIAEEDIYIPKKRLKPSDPRPQSRPNSHGRHFSNAPGYRNPIQLEYEPLDDLLIDLLHRLLTKDPKKRITVEEARHHPWVLADIPDKAAWLDETDPSRQAEGAKIEVSREDIEHSVVPITIMERIRSGLKKAVAVGLGRSASTKRRAPSNNGSSTSINSASSTPVSEYRRHSLRGDENIFNALKASREGDHPLAQSTVASPDQSPTKDFFTQNSSLGATYDDVEPSTPMTGQTSSRDRQASTMSTTGSSRTVRQSDLGYESWKESSPPDSNLLSSSVEGPGGSHPGNLLKDGAGKYLKGVHDRSTASRNRERRDRSPSLASSDIVDNHADASLAISTASAAGKLDPPQALKDITPGSSKSASPVLSMRTSAVTSPGESLERIHTLTTTQRLVDKLPPSVAAVMISDSQPGSRSASRPASRSGSRLQNESTEEDFERADNENLRRHIAESLNRPTQNLSRTTSAQRQEACPPSPDDDIYPSRNKRFAIQSTSSVAPSSAPSLEMSPGSPTSSVLPLMTPSTSEDRFNSIAASVASNHSGRSFISMGNSPPEPFYAHYASKDDDDSDEGDESEADDSIEMAMPHRPVVRYPVVNPSNDEDEGYHPDNEAHIADGAVESEEEYDSDEDEEGALVMMPRRGGTGRTLSITSATLARRRERRETGGSGWSKKSSRSGSNNTMKKVRTRSYGDVDHENVDGTRERRLSSADVQE